MNLILIRHGECLKEDKDPALTPRGISQSKLLAKRLAKIPITKVFVSNLVRAFQTFEEYHKLAPNIPFERTEQLNEIYRVLVGEPPKDGTAPTREPNDKKRIELFIRKISSLKNEENIAIIAHGNVIRYILAKFLGSDPKKIGYNLAINPTSLSLITIEKNKSCVKFINNLDHLADEKFFSKNQGNEDYRA